MPNVDNLSDQNKSLKENSPLEGNSQETNETPTSSRTCSKFDYCSAPICPVDQIGAIWYPFEETCTAHAFSSLPWVKQQRKIARKARNVDFFFNYEMLCQNCVITCATEGLDPDKTEINDERALELWLGKHPEKRELTEEEREIKRKSFNANVLSRTPVQKDQMALKNEGISYSYIEDQPSGIPNYPQNISPNTSPEI